MFSVKVRTNPKNSTHKLSDHAASSSKPSSPKASSKTDNAQNLTADTDNAQDLGKAGPSTQTSPIPSQPTTPRTSSQNTKDQPFSQVEQLGFSAGNPRVEHITGVVHLYRHIPIANPAEIHDNNGSDELPEGRNEQLCVLGLPPDMGFAEFCTFLGAFFQKVKEMRLVRKEGGANVCLVLLKFESLEAADEFYTDFNGVPFCILEPHLICRLVYVKELEFSNGTTTTTTTTTTSPPSQQQPSTTEYKTTELPSCPVCLERLDEHVSGIVTTVCNHRFHNDCLRRWGDTSCPVCRYCQHPTQATSHCNVCGSAADLWICLICGHVGCGRYCGSHAAAHWQESGHGYSLELETQRVWDYASDAYVHRLVRSKTDGKLVEVGAAAGGSYHLHNRNGGGGGGGGGFGGVNGGGGRSRGGEYDECDECGQGGGRGGHVEPDMEEALVLSKLDALATEYNHLLVTQLESQRQHFEALLVRQRQELDSTTETFTAQLADLQQAIQLAQSTTTEAERRRHQLENKVNDLSTKLSKAVEERDFLKQLNDTLLANQKDFKEKLAAAVNATGVKAAEVVELQEQVRDLMVFIEARQTIEQQGGGELQGGSVMGVADAPGAARRKNKSKGRK